MTTYSPADFRALTFHDATPRFADGTDTPRAYLERCLETIAQRESVVRAWVVMNQPGAREAADAEARRTVLGALARGGFAQPVARRVLAMDPAEAEERLVALGCPKVQLMVRRDNEAARGFYDALGYEPVDVWMAGRRLIADG